MTFTEFFIGCVIAIIVVMTAVSVYETADTRIHSSTVCALNPSERVVRYSKSGRLVFRGQAYSCDEYGCGWDNTGTSFPPAQVEDMCGLKPGSLLKPGKRKVK